MNQLEQSNVYNVYNKIGDDFSNTRIHPWPVVKRFLDNVSPYSLVCDVGSGNGKNIYRRDLSFIASDFSEKMCELSYLKEDTVQSNILSLPFRDNIFDTVISIACIHHLTSESRRVEAIKECIRILKPNGKLLFSVWANSDKYGCGDQMITWNNKESRFYHLYSENEVITLCNTFNLKYEFNKHNYFISS